MTNKLIARRLKLTADLIELTGGNAFRARAFASAGRTVDRMEEAVLQLVERGELVGIQGIGKGIAADITELVQTGSFESLDRIVESLPPGLLDMLRVKGLGPKKARALWTGLGVTSLEDLEHAAASGQIASLDGFGKKTQETILKNVAQLKVYRSRRRYREALGAVGPVVEALRETPGVARAELTGELRRQLETVGEAEILVAGDPEAILATLRDWVETGGAENADDALFAGTIEGLKLRVHHASLEGFAAAWWQHTGSDEHVASFVAAYGAPESESEAGIYDRAGLGFVPPALREATGELEAAAHGSLPDLVTVEDLRGTIHNHSTYSDGAHTLRQMAEAARARGLEYFGICDHSRSLKIANGLSIERLREQGDEVRALNEAFANDGGPSFRIFHGNEVDILADGTLDYPDDVLAELDLVVASVHTHFNMSEAEATERIVRAVAHPHVHVLGHMTGRLLLAREGYPVDHHAVIEACAEHGVAIELNANPYRLDMDWRWIREATAQGVLIAINPDAHAIDGLDDVRWGVAAAQKGWLTAAHCLTAKSADAFADWLAARAATV